VKSIYVLMRPFIFDANQGVAIMHWLERPHKSIGCQTSCLHCS